jgi:phosphoribosylformylglycinamidine synthase
MLSNVRVVPIRSADDESLLEISRAGTLSLNLAEMRAIQAYFRQKQRDPTDVELETLAQTWSEHCVHKTFRGIIEYRESESVEVIDNLLRSTVARATHELDRDFCVSVFKDNAGIVRFNDDYHVAFKVETHNHPSAIEPYGGAGTGIGGVIRDILGTGLGAKPVLNTDVFCFGLPDTSYDDLPSGVLHPKRIFKGVVAGVRDYGNRMGIPTVNGAILFDARYAANPLVFAGTVGLIPVDRVEKGARPGDLILAVGGRTGRDGIHGATFSSLELDDTSETLGSVVQIGNPIIEKMVTDTLLRARDNGLYRDVTDCGAGGFSSAVGEMGKETGARVYLDRVPLKYTGLAPWEIWLSEAQERMVLAVPPENRDAILDLFEAENVEATVLGEFTNTGRLEVFYGEELVGELDMAFLHDGIPRPTKRAVWNPPERAEPVFPEPDDLTDALTAILASPNVASKEWVIRQYDHEVQGGIVLKPLQGVNNDGPGDACVAQPALDALQGVVIANGINPRYGDLDPYWMAALAIDEAIRNVVAVGGHRDRTALLDNFSWGNPDKPDRLAGLVRAAKACYDVAKAYETPFISGKDSLYNEYRDSRTGEQVAIPGTLLISAVCVIDDVTRVVSMDVKKPGDVVYALGRTYRELGGSHYYALRDALGASVPRVRPDEGRRTMDALSDAIREGVVNAAHDCSEGGIAVAVAEMAFSGGFGVALDASRLPVAGGVHRCDESLFSESASRFIVTVPPENAARFDAMMNASGVVYGRVGTVTESPRLVVRGTDGRTRVDASLDALKSAWQRTFAW